MTLFPRPLVAALLLLICGSTPLPADDITSKEDLNAIFTAAQSIGDRRIENLRKGLLMEWITRTYEVRPLFGPIRMDEKYQAVQDEFARRNGVELGGATGDSQDLYWSLAGILSAFAAPEIGLGIAVGDFARQQSQDQIYGVDSFLRASELVRLSDSELAAKAEKLDRMRQQNALVDIVAERILGLPRGQSAMTLYESTDFLNLSPELQSLVSRINAEGQLPISREDLVELFNEVLESQGALRDEIRGVVGQLLANQGIEPGDLRQYMSDPQRRAANQALIAARETEWQKKIDAANASVYILSSLVGLNDPKLGHEMQLLGSSTVRIVDALSKFAKADALTSVVLTGNIVGAVLNVVSLFGDSGPSPDQQILEGIRQLQQMVHQLRVEMHERFDRVDAALNQIYTTMNDRFDRIDIALGVLHGDVQEIQESLHNLQSDLHRIEGKVFAFLDAGFRRDLNETINGYLGYYETYGQPIPWLSYVFAENKFHTWAVNNALDEISSGSAGRGYDDISLYAELGAPSAPPLENNLNYLAQYLATKGWPAFTTVRLANPRDWAIAANAWMELAGESPMLFRQVSSNRLEQINRVGQDLLRAITNITLVQANPSPVAHRALFNALFANYRAKATVFNQRLSEKEQEFRLSISSDLNKREPLRALNLWDGPEQSTLYQRGIAPSVNTQGVTNRLVPPTGWVNSAAIADLVGFNITYSDYEMINQHIEMIDIFGGRCGGVVGTFRIRIQGRFATTLVLDRLYTHTNAHRVPEAAWTRCSCIGFECSHPWFASTWSWPVNLRYSWECIGVEHCGGLQAKDSFVARSISVSPADTNLSVSVDRRLRELQRGSYSAILNSLSQAGSLQNAAIELSGAKACLDSFIVLGFSQSLEGNDFLHSLVSGGDRVLDMDAIKVALTNGIAMTFDTSQNAKVDIAAILDERINALETWVSNRLTQVKTNGRAESLRLVSSTLNRLDAFRAGWSQPTPAPYLAPLGFRLTNGVPNRLFIVWGEPNLRYTVQLSTNLTHWADLPTAANEGQDFITTPSNRSTFYRATLRP